MASYIDTVLGPGETLEYRAKISPWSFLSTFISVAALTIGGLIMLGNDALRNMGMFMLAVALASALRAYIWYISTELGLTARRVIAKTGFIRRDTIEINLEKIESIQIAQSVPGRVFNYGTITLSGSGSTHAPIRGVDDPIAFRKKFDETCARHRKTTPTY